MLKVKKKISEIYSFIYCKNYLKLNLDNNLFVIRKKINYKLKMFTFLMKFIKNTNRSSQLKSFRIIKNSIR